MPDLLRLLRLALLVVEVAEEHVGLRVLRLRDARGLLLLHQALRQNRDLDESVKEARRAGLKQPLEERLLQRIAAEK